MKKLMVKKGAECMACLECVRACSVAFHKEFNEDLSCIRIVEKNGAAKPMTCIQCYYPESQDWRVYDQQEALHCLRQVC